MDKTVLLHYLADETRLLNIVAAKKSLTADVISLHFGVKRNTISSYLNQMLKEGKVVKINTRPVYFINREAFETMYGPLDRLVYESFSELINPKKQSQDINALSSGIKPPLHIEKTDVFNELTGVNGSLHRIVKQIKMAALYPGNGLPVFISGPTGVGKSLMARLLYKYCIEKGVLDEEAPFIIFNCAQYVNNPELLSANLFGYTKGAFTGAEKATKGVIESADGGILFIDEVHRLSPEGQEKLFIFMDTGSFRRLGESSETQQAQVRLVFATTQSLKDLFLDTFIRRLTVSFVIPALEERGWKEKQEILYSAFIDESQVLKCEIELPDKIKNLLLYHVYTGNVGELKDTVKYICANAYSHNPGTDRLKIRINHLPDKLLVADIDNPELKTSKSDERIVFSSKMERQKFFQKESRGVFLIKQTFEKILIRFSSYQDKNISRKVFEKAAVNEVVTLTNMLVSLAETPEENKMMKYLTASIQEIFKYLEHSQNLKFNRNGINALAGYFYFRMNNELYFDNEKMTELGSLYNYIIENYKKEKFITGRLIDLFEKMQEFAISMEDEIFLFFFCNNIGVENKHQLKAVIIAHGSSTACSIANFVNRMLHHNVLEFFDIQPGTSTAELTANLLDYIRENDTSKGLLLMIDLGSLADIYRDIENHVKGPLAIISNVSTQIAFMAGELILSGDYIEEIIEKIRKANETSYNILYPKLERKKVLITSCSTGLGTAMKLQKFLQNSIPPALNIEVITYDFERIKDATFQSALLSLYEVIGIVGTIDPNIKNVNFVPLSDLISGNGMEMINEMFRNFAGKADADAINRNIVRNFTLENVMNALTILDSKKVMEIIDVSYARLERLFDRLLPNDKRYTLYIHVGCMVERLMRQDEVLKYPNVEEFEQCQQKILNNLKDAFSVIELTYSVMIPVAELGFIYDILHLETVNSGSFC